MKPVSVVGLGMGGKDLTLTARETIDRAKVLAGGERALACFPDHQGRRIKLSGDLEAFLARVREAASEGPVAVLASGDPGFYGIARLFVERLGGDQVEVVPGISTVQAAFARLGLPWHEAAVVSLHGRKQKALLPALLHSDTVAVYTDPQNTPAAVAKLLLERGQAGWAMIVLEDLGAADERVSHWDLAEATKKSFSDLNLVILQRSHRPAPLHLGIPEDDLAHQAGLISKREVRAVALSLLRLAPQHTLWDLGAGSGALGLEACYLLWQGRVVAVEKDPERRESIEVNRRKFGAANLEIVEARMPRCLDDLPDPDRVFVGGGGKDVAAIVLTAAERLPAGGVMVVSVVRLESLAAARAALIQSELHYDSILLQVARGAPLGAGEFMRALNPVWLLSGVKP